MAIRFSRHRVRLSLWGLNLALLWLAVLLLLSARNDAAPLGGYSIGQLTGLAVLLVILAGLVWRRAVVKRFASGGYHRSKAAILIFWLLGLAALGNNAQFLPPTAFVAYWILGLALILIAWPSLVLWGRRATSREFLKNAAVVTASVLFTIGVLEGGLRVWLYQIAPQEALAKYDPSRARVINWAYAPHHYLNYYLRPNYSSPTGNRHNSQGYRQEGEIPVPKPSGEFRILVLGGSTTYGEGAPDWRDSYPIQLQGILRKKLGIGSIRVINGGVPGYNSWESLINLQFRGLELEPDLVVIYHGTNDVHARLVAPEHYSADNSGRRKPWDDRETSSWQHRVPSVLWRVVAGRLGWLPEPSLRRLVVAEHAARRPKSAGPNTRLGTTPMEALRANPPVYFERNLRSMVALARVHGARVLLLTFAHNPEISRPSGRYASTEHYGRGFAENNAVVRRVAADMKTLFFDLKAHVPLTSGLWVVDGIHFTKAGNRLVAELLGDYLNEAGALPRPTPKN